jgi:serine/threonine protein kinase
MAEEARKSPVRPGDIVGGKYRVDRVLGSGGMGVVVAATHTELDQAVALKFILPETLSGKDAIERFMREARSVAKLKSEHVARVYDVGRDEQNNPYMVLELLEGVDLARLNRDKGPLAVADAVEFVLQTCEALVEAHTAGIVHRDLKPQNIHVGKRLNGMPLVKVLDFGIAKAVGAAAVGQMALTDSQAVIGSPLYMAPEHMRSARAADTRSDIWSLGVILYEILGGQLPFDGETVTEVCIRVVNEAPPSLLSLRPGLDPTLITTVMRCLEKDPAARWQNVAQLATALEPFSRSAQHGGALRPWRSFEDTMDSNRSGPSQAHVPVAPAVGAITPSSPLSAPPLNGSGKADDTGPSTAITMPTGPELQKVLNAAATPQPGSLPPLSQPPISQQVPQPTSPLVSTNTTWGTQGTNPNQAAATRPSFTKGIVVGVVVSLAAAAVLVVGLRSVVLQKKAADNVPPAAAASTVAVAASTAEPPPAAVSALPEPAPVATPAPTPSLTAAAKGARPPLVTTGRARTSATTAAATATVSAPPAPPPKTAETQAPNGAPILR